MKEKGRVTLPIEANFKTEIEDLMNRLGADAIRDSDGTKLDEETSSIDAKVYSTYFVARGDNEFARMHLDETQQMYLTSSYNLATSTSCTISFLDSFLEDQIVPNYDYDPVEWWQVWDRTNMTLVDMKDVHINQEDNTVTISNTIPFHEYSVSYLAYMRWDPTQMYNYITNNWTDREKDIPFDARGKNSHKHMVESLRTFLEENPKVDVIRFTTFFYHFTLFFNDKKKEKFVDWFGYGSSVSPQCILDFEKEYGYRLVAEDFIQAGSYNSTYANPTPQYLDYIDFQQRFVAQRAKELVDVVHEYGKEAMMFLGDNWIGTEPYGPYFKDIGLDAVVGSVGGGTTLRVISDIPHVKYTEGRYLPYFFPDTFFEGNIDNILKEANENWIGSRRALLRSPLDRIGYGGYPSLAYKFPKFIDYLEEVTNEFRNIISNIGTGKPYSKLKVGFVSPWGKLRSWQLFMVAHALHYKQIYSYFGILECLSGLDVDVEFISFDEILDGKLEDIDVLINAGDAKTAFSGDTYWDNPKLVQTIRQWVYEGHGYLGIGEPSAYLKGGRFFQLADVLGIDKELGLTLSTDKYFNKPLDKHFLKEDITQAYWYGEEINNTYALYEDTEIVAMDNENITISAHNYGKGRGVYLMGLPYSIENTRLLYRSLLYACKKEDTLLTNFSSNICCEINLYPETNKVCIVNNTNVQQQTTVYDGLGNTQELTLKPSEIKWGVSHEKSYRFTS